MGSLTAGEVLDAVIAEHSTGDTGPRRRVLDLVRKHPCPRMLNVCLRAANARARNLGEDLPPIVTTDDMVAYLDTELGADFLLHLYRQMRGRYP